MGRKALGKLAVAATAALLLVSSWGCGGEENSSPAGDATTGAQAAGPEGATAERSGLILASTTSTEDSGLFDALLPAFGQAFPQYDVKVVAVGTGEALRLGEEQAADVLLVHAPQAEEDFVQRGLGVERREVMYNDFVVVGPESDPAGIRGETEAVAGLQKIASAAAEFISRGDESGTHKKELGLWQAAGIEPAGDWYRDVGQGMGEVLRIASEKQAYALTDRATYLSNQETLELAILLEGDEALFNQYGVIPVAGARNARGAQDFTDWITSAQGQEVIGAFGVDKFGQPLFVPNAKN